MRRAARAPAALNWAGVAFPDAGERGSLTPFGVDEDEHPRGKPKR